MTTPHKQTPNPYTLPVVIVGMVALDIAHFWNDDRTAQHVRIGVGGVCKHVACVLGNLGVTPRFVTTHFSGEFGRSLENILNTNHVEWRPLSASAPPSLFEGHLDARGRIFDETFIEGEALELLTPDALRYHDALVDARIIVSCTNLSVAALNALADMANQSHARFWLLNSSALETPKIGQVEHSLDLVSLNVEELQRLVNRPLETLSQIAVAALAIKPVATQCLVTLGSRGALLCQQGIEYALYQPVEPIAGRSPIGGGDVLFAGMLAGKIQRHSWEAAFAFGARCTRAYLLRDQTSATPYAGLALVTDDPLPPIERVPIDHDS